MNSDTTPTSSTDLYFEDAQTLYDEYRDQRETIAQKQDSLTALSNRLETIDCDLGSASLEINNDGTIVVGIATSEFPDEVKSLPEGFVRTAKSDICGIEAMSDTDRDLYGVQWHPEVAHTDEGEAVFENFRVLCE